MSYTSENENESFDCSYALEVTFPFLVTEEGIIFVGHFIYCKGCKLIYPVYIDMRLVSNTKGIFTSEAKDSEDIFNGLCVNCGYIGLHVMTYRKEVPA